MAPPNPSPRRRLLVSLLLAGALVAVSKPAGARETFPGIVQDKYPELNCAPPCTICHTSPAGGGDTVTQPFVLNLLEANLNNSIDESNLVAILDFVQTQPCRNLSDKGCNPVMGVCTGICDANGDGTTDIEQLSKGIDPNTGKKLFCVTYGCGGAHVAPKPHGRSFDGTAALAALGALIVLAGRFRRARAS